MAALPLLPFLPPGLSPTAPFATPFAALALLLVFILLALAARLVSSPWLPFRSARPAPAEALPTSTRRTALHRDAYPPPLRGRGRGCTHGYVPFPRFLGLGKGRRAKNLGPVLPRFRVDADADAELLLDLLSLLRPPPRPRHLVLTPTPATPPRPRPYLHPHNEGKIIIDMRLEMELVDVSVPPSPAAWALAHPPASPGVVLQPTTIDAMNSMNTNAMNAMNTTAMNAMNTTTIDAMNRALSPRRARVPTSPPPRSPRHLRGPASRPHCLRLPGCAVYDLSLPPVLCPAAPPLHVAQHRVAPAARLPFGFAVPAPAPAPGPAHLQRVGVILAAAPAVRDEAAAAHSPDHAVNEVEAAPPPRLVDLAVDAHLGAEVDGDADAPGYSFPTFFSVPVPARAFDALDAYDAHAHGEYELGELEAQAEVGEEGRK
ncbi:hypothetical protein DFH09DRAFT_1399201 [Mycena vulgaris]|nr:hypothetical protein DFH09DRAFT_1399201 [Mycena vulgaris]